MSSIQKVFLIIITVYLIGFVTHAAVTGKTVYGDGIYYFSWLRSAVIDRDVSFDNEYRHLGGSQQVTPIGKTGNIYALGPALIWSPAYIWIHSVIRGDGYSFPYQLTIGFYDVLLVITSFVFLYLSIKDRLDKNEAVFAVLMCAFTTNILYYGSLDTVNSHSVSFFASTLLFLALTRKNALFSGLALGLLAATRIQDGIFVLAFIPYIRDIKFVIKSAFAFLVIFSSQLIAWHTLYGTWGISPYTNLAGYSFNWFQPKILSVLFSPQSGLFLWTPTVLLGLMVLIYKTAQKPMMTYLLYICVMCIEVYVIGSWNVWWQGASYSGRVFVSTLPIITLGFGELYRILVRQNIKPKHLYLYILIPFTLLNVSAMIYFLKIT